MTKTPIERAYEKLAGISRRQLMIAGAGVGVAGLAGGAWYLTRDPKDLVVALLVNALPGITVDRASAEVCAQDFMDEFYGAFGEGVSGELLISAAKLHAAEAVRETAGVRTIAEQAPFAGPAREIVRRVITRFLMNSSFFYLDDPTSEPIVYSFRPFGTPCTNPWANLSPPKPEDVVPYVY